MRYLSHKGTYHGSTLSQEKGFQSAHELAVQMRGKLAELGVTRLFVATNARRLEMDLFKAVIKGEPATWRRAARWRVVW